MQLAQFRIRGGYLSNQFIFSFEEYIHKIIECDELLSFLWTLTE